jgi:hypothetical protein
LSHWASQPASASSRYHSERCTAAVDGRTSVSQARAVPSQSWLFACSSQRHVPSAYFSPLAHTRLCLRYRRHPCPRSVLAGAHAPALVALSTRRPQQVRPTSIIYTSARHQPSATTSGPRNHTNTKIHTHTHARAHRNHIHAHVYINGLCTQTVSILYLWQLIRHRKVDELATRYFTIELLV